MKLLDAPLLLVGKEKADMVEAIVGELAETLKDQTQELHHRKIKSVLDKLLGFIQFSGEQSFAIETPLHTSPAKTRTEAKENTDKRTSPSKKLSNDKQIIKREVRRSFHYY